MIRRSVSETSVISFVLSVIAYEGYWFLFTLCIYGAETSKWMREDKAARNARQNRSALISDALREHLRTPEIRALEKRDRDGYARHGQEDESLLWEKEVVWPEE
jgi:hypothetical protein